MYRCKCFGLYVKVDVIELSAYPPYVASCGHSIKIKGAVFSLHSFIEALNLKGILAVHTIRNKESSMFFKCFSST